MRGNVVADSVASSVVFPRARFSVPVCGAFAYASLLLVDTAQAVSIFAGLVSLILALLISGLIIRARPSPAEGRGF